MLLLNIAMVLYRKYINWPNQIKWNQFNYIKHDLCRKWIQNKYKWRGCKVGHMPCGYDQYTYADNFPLLKVFRSSLPKPLFNLLAPEIKAINAYVERRDTDHLKHGKKATFWMPASRIRHLNSFEKKNGKRPSPQSACFFRSLFPTAQIYQVVSQALSGGYKKFARMCTQNSHRLDFILTKTRVLLLSVDTWKCLSSAPLHTWPTTGRQLWL